MKKPNYVIVFGPPASGKTLNAAALKRHYKCDYVFDIGFHDRQIAESREKILILSHTKKVKDPRDRRRLIQNAVFVSIQEAAAAIGSESVVPVHRIQSNPENPK